MEKASETYQVKIQELFPDLDVKDKQKTVDTFSDVIDDIFSVFYDSEYIQYMVSRPEHSDIAKYLSKVPNGVDNFEIWLKTYLEKMSSQLTTELQKILPPNTSLIYFAQLLDSQDFDTYFKKVKYANKMKLSFKKGLLEIFNEKALKHFIQAMSCSCIGLLNSANSLNYLWIQSALFEDEDLYKVINEAKKLEAVSKHTSDAGKKGRDKRYEKRDLIKAEALKRKSLKKYKNNNQAAIKLCDEICDFAESIGRPFTDRFTAKDRLYEWFREK